MSYKEKKLDEKYHLRVRQQRATLLSISLLDLSLDRSIIAFEESNRLNALAEFDQKKRSCRRRLSDHNARRHKPQPDTFTFGSTRLSSPFYDERRHISFMWNKSPFGLMEPVTSSSWEGPSNLKFSSEKELRIKPAKATGGLVDGQILLLGSQNGNHNTNVNSNLSNHFLTLSYDVDGLLPIKGITVQVLNQGPEATATAASNLDRAPDLRHSLSLSSVITYCNYCYQLCLGWFP